MNVSGKKILITGGLGFIGLNAIEYFAKCNDVFVIDDGSRIGCDVPADFLKSLKVRLFQLDISHLKQLRLVYDQIQPDVILHLAAQVAVTLSITNPLRDFYSNAQGTLNLLELARQSKTKPIFIYASTNKVYGDLKQPISLKNGRYVLDNELGFDESTPLSFLTPYGCSKGGADQYVLDYSRTYGLRCVVLRQSCIYGPHQYGFEDQGWVAWFAISAILNKPLTIYGDGCQVRDVLYVEDLIDLYARCIEKIDAVSGQAFNIGGGPGYTLAVNELVSLLEKKIGKSLAVKKGDWRLGDQKVFICDIRKAKHMLGWQPRVDPHKGLNLLIDWIKSNQETISRLFESNQHVGKRFDLSIVIPARNEEECMASVLDEVKSFLDTSIYKTQVIVVNDRSTDRTKAIASQYSFVEVVDNPHPSGKGYALRAGFEVAQGEYIVMMDADFSHDVMDLPYLIEEAHRTQGLVIGSRITGGSEEYTRIRAFGNIILTWFFGCVHGRYVSDALNGFKVFHRDVYRNFEYTSKNFEIEIELLVNVLRLNRPVTEIPSRERSRKAGIAKSFVIKHGTLFALRILWEKFRTVKLRHG